MLDKLISLLQEELKKKANIQTKEWFENYLKGAISYYGVKTPEAKSIVAIWSKNNQVSNLSISKQFNLCKKLMKLEHAEEKFAAIIYIQQYLIKNVETEELLNLAEWFFEQNCFFDWSTADWFTVRVLNNIIKKDENCLKRISSWNNASSLWQRRASIVCLRAVVRNKKYIPLIEKTTKLLVKEKQRFIQTGIGWTLSDLSKIFPQQASQIVEEVFFLS